MSKYLLDTHILLWSLLEPELLPAKVKSELENPANEIWLSPITTWEIMVLAEKGRIELNAEPVVWMKNVLDSIPFKEAVLNHEVAMKSREIKLPHQDPADRFIAASAMIYDLILMTSDKNIIDASDGFTVFQ